MVRKLMTHLNDQNDVFGCTSKLENCSPLAQFCAVKMPPRLLMSNSTLNHVWSQNCCTDLYGLKGSSLLHH